MKLCKRNVILALVWGAVILFGVEACAQSFALPEMPDKPGALYELFTPVLLSFVLVGLSYLTYLIPGLNKIKDTQVRVVVFILVSALGFVYYGFSFVSVFAAAFMSQGWYLFIFKPLGLKTPKVAGYIDPRSDEEIEAGRIDKHNKMNGNG